MKFGAIVMVAGLGTRMKSSLPKVLHPLCGKPLLFYILETLQKAKATKVAVVVSHKKEDIIQWVRTAFGPKAPFVFVDQQKPLGTGHAVLKTEKVFKGFNHPLLILSGDVPLIKSQTLTGLLRHHHSEKADLTFGTCDLDPSTPYGRVIRDAVGNIVEVVETPDATPDQLTIKEMNIGLYCVNARPLFQSLKKISPNNKKKEYYLPDIIKSVQRKTTYSIQHPEEIVGINNRWDLHEKEQHLRSEINKEWMLRGVTIVDSSSTYIESTVKLGKDVTVYPQAHLRGKTVVGDGTTIGPGCMLTHARLGKNVKLEAYTVVEESRVDDQAMLGPFGRLRPGSHVKKKGKVGNFVELKKTTLGEGSKANHLTYLGDAEIGKDVNVGCGVITCNYDGGLRFKGKAKTKIGDHSFVGSDVQLVAPLNLQKGSYIASGTTVTDNTPPDSLVIGRAKQVTKKGYMKKLWARAAQQRKRKQ